MDKYSVGMLLMLRPFEVWIASYTLLQILERKDVSNAIEYIFLGLNAFATLILGYMAFLAKRSDMNDVWSNLTASVSVIWILWIFIGLYKTISNNRRGVTISLAKEKMIDRVMLCVVVPVAFLMAARMVAVTLILRKGSLLENQNNLFQLLLGIVLAIIVIIYLISTVKRFERYVVFGSKTVEVWKKDRGKVFKYSQIAELEQVGSAVFDKYKYKVVFLKDDDKETIFPDDSRMEYVKKELERIIKEKAVEKSKKNEISRAGKQTTSRANSQKVPASKKGTNTTTKPAQTGATAKAAKTTTKTTTKAAKTNTASKNAQRNNTKGTKK